VPHLHAATELTISFTCHSVTYPCGNNL